MGKKGTAAKTTSPPAPAGVSDFVLRISCFPRMRVIYCGDCLEQIRNLPDACVDLIYISQIRRGGDPPFNSNRNYEVFWGGFQRCRQVTCWRYFDSLEVTGAKSGNALLRLRSAELGGSAEHP
jgi:hypothetical protein